MGKDYSRHYSNTKERLLKNRRLCDLTGCWIWTGSSTGPRPYNYGVIKIRPQMDQPPIKVKVHRLAYELFVGPIPNGMVIGHFCDTPLCFNPEHLFVGTQ